MLRILFIFLVCFPIPLLAQKKLSVVTTLPDLAEVVRDVGGDLVEVSSLLTGGEDPHFMDASPDFIKKLSRADVVCFVGLELETGWLPKVLQRSNNAKLQSGGPGYCDTGSGVEVLEKPSTKVDRSMGDVHGSGNPHFYLSPDALAQAAVVVERVLSQSLPNDKERFAPAREKFQKRMRDLKNSVAGQLKDAGPVMEYHKEFTYFFNVYGIYSLGSIEELPGVPPSIKRLAEVAKSAKAGGVKLALGANSTSEKHLKKFSELSGVPYRQLPAMVQALDPNLNSIEKLQNFLALAISGETP